MPACSVWKVSWATLQYEDALLREYAAECSIAALGTINPQWAMYEQLERSGCFQMFGAYVDGSTRMIGFATVISHVLPHYGVKAAVVESLFVAAASRGTLAGAGLMKAIDEHALRLGCKAVLYSAPNGGVLERVLNERCERTNAVFCKGLV